MTSSFVNDDVRFINNVSKTKKKMGKNEIIHRFYLHELGHSNSMDDQMISFVIFEGQ